MPKSQSISYIWRWNLKIKLCTINKTAPVIMSETILNNVITWSIYMDNTDYTTLKIYTCKYKGIHWTLFHKMDNLLSLCCQKSVNGWYAENSSLKMKYNWIRDQCTVHPVVVYFTGGGEENCNGNHCFTSDDQNHDTHFVHELQRIFQATGAKQD